MNCPVLLQYPDQFISNTKVVQNRSTNPDTQPTRMSDVHDTPGLIFPPPDTLSSNHPERVLHPRMNSRSVQRVSYNDRSPLTLHTSCHSSVCYDCFVFTVSSPPKSPIDPAATSDYIAAVYDYVDDDRTPTAELPGKQCPHLFLISPICLYLSICTRHCCCYVLTYSTA